ncbi:hypothetical protein CALCODRAFT_495000 [Calocera cornea HHB12733]|uniref:FAD-binding FR-type domain-containing protein n=1 Tax=Calocera cornea HHB12733 TaxID=1353952 RepID=A0A165GU95_9BASI|nr:hypothetical protein CALCODRAFT_495000 [Calocera cornea HHB12733]
MLSLGLYLGFLAWLNHHTHHAKPWIISGLAIYACDLVARMMRMRYKTAYLEPVGDQMTLVHIPHAAGRWRAGQHVRLRLVLGTRILQAHPLTIINSAPTGDKTRSQGMWLAARVAGDWTGELNGLGKTHLRVIFDGPYGSAQIQRKERTLCLAGGSGATFTLGVLDESITAVENGDQRVRVIEWVWFIRSYGTHSAM